MESAKKTLDRVVEWVCVVLLAVMTVLVTFQVVVRYFFNSPNAYMKLLSRYMSIQMAVYDSTYVFGLQEYMNIGFVRDHIPSETRVVVEMLGELMVALLAAGVMISGGYKQVTSQVIQMDTAFQILMGTVYSAVSVSACFILFYFIYNEMKLAKKPREI